MEARSSIPPGAYDVLITDIDDDDLKAIGVELGVVRHDAASSAPTFPVRGIMYGANSRLFVCLTVKKRDRAVNVLFLVDTGSPSSYLRRDTFEALGYTESIPKEANVELHGFPMPVSLSHAHFYNVDLLGQSFFRTARARLEVDYEELWCEVRIKGATQQAGSR